MSQLRGCLSTSNNNQSVTNSVMRKLNNSSKCDTWIPTYPANYSSLTRCAISSGLSAGVNEQELRTILLNGSNLTSNFSSFHNKTNMPKIFMTTTKATNRTMEPKNINFDLSKSIFSNEKPDVVNNNLTPMLPTDFQNQIESFTMNFNEINNKSNDISLKTCDNATKLLASEEKSLLINYANTSVLKECSRNRSCQKAVISTTPNHESQAEIVKVVMSVDAPAKCHSEDVVSDESAEDFILVVNKKSKHNDREAVMQSNSHDWDTSKVSSARRTTSAFNQKRPQAMEAWNAANPIRSRNKSTNKGFTTSNEDSLVCGKPTSEIKADCLFFPNLSTANRNSSSSGVSSSSISPVSKTLESETFQIVGEDRWDESTVESGSNCSKGSNCRPSACQLDVRPSNNAVENAWFRNSSSTGGRTVKPASTNTCLLVTGCKSGGDLTATSIVDMLANSWTVFQKEFELLQNENKSRVGFL